MKQDMIVILDLGSTENTVIARRIRDMGVYLSLIHIQQCNMIITTTPAFVQASVKAAIAYPQIRILNCSLNTSHRYIRTYYARMYEAKFVMGAVAGAMTENDKISYLADIPLYGTIADINAFARGVSLVCLLYTSGRGTWKRTKVRTASFVTGT